MSPDQDAAISAIEPIRAKIRRWVVPNAVYFITAVTLGRQSLFASADNMRLLRETMHQAKALYPFTMYAYAFMPDHFHLLIFVPAKTHIGALMHSIQRNYTLNYKAVSGTEEPLHLWQRGFWDHVIRDEADMERHFDYIHYNPVKHGYVTMPRDYPHTSFGEYLRRGWYGPAWAKDGPPSGIESSCSEPQIEGMAR